MRFMAMASVVWASRLMEPKLIAPVEKRLTISAAGSTSSSGTRRVGRLAAASGRAMVSSRSLCSLMPSANARYSAGMLPRTACCRRATESGVQAWSSPRRRKA